MKKTTIISLGVAVLLLGGIVWIAQPSSGSEQRTQDLSGGELTVDGDRFYDFGSISMAKGEVKTVFTLKNKSANSVVIKKVYTSCMCTTAWLNVPGKRWGPFGMAGHGFIPSIDQVINPSEEGTVEVVFDPAAHGPAGVGRIDRVVRLENSAGNPIELSFRATVTP